jgi:hypothetical protein
VKQNANIIANMYGQRSLAPFTGLKIVVAAVATGFGNSVTAAPPPPPLAGTVGAASSTPVTIFSGPVEETF